MDVVVHVEQEFGLFSRRDSNVIVVLRTEYRE